MFRKLLKYEWRAMMRTMLPIYGATLAVALINGFLFQNVCGTGSETPALLEYTRIATMTLYIVVMAAMGVFTAVMVIQRFYKGLLRQEGYLMFTLPVKTWQLVFSKACVSLAATFCSLTVGILSLGMFGGIDFFGALFQIPGLIVEFIQEGMAADRTLFLHCMVFGVELLLALAVGTLSSIYELYFSMALGQMSRNHKIIWSVLWFVAVSTVFNFISMVPMGNASLFVRFLDGMENGVAFLHVLGLGLLAMQAVSLALLMGGTGYVLERRLNLE